MTDDATIGSNQQAEAKKKVLRMIHYGLFVMTARRNEEIVAGTVTWLSQCSFQPPLIMVGVKVASRSFEAIKDVRKFAINVLGESQQEIAALFFKESEVGAGTLNGIPFHQGVTGAPLLDGVPGIFECEVTDIIERGDHAVVVGEVVNAETSHDEPALALRSTGWYYGG